jgi:signal peptidase
MNRTKTLINWAFTIVVVSGICFAAFMVILSLLGWQFNPVMSGSMDPVFKVGDVIVSQQVDPANVQVGDIVTYRSSEFGKVVVHRVVEKCEGDSLYFITKGDSNEYIDPYPVPAENVMNKIGFHIPYLGHVSNLIKSGPWVILLFALPLLLLFGRQIQSIFISFLRVQKRREIIVAVQDTVDRGQWPAGLEADGWLKGQTSI